MQIDVNSLVVILGLLGTIGGMIVALYKLFSRFEKVEKHTLDRKEDSEIMFKTLLGIMDGLIEQGCNGPVKQARKELLEYMAER